MELESLDNLERQIGRLLEKYLSIKKAREELALRVGHLESENTQLRQTNSRLQKELGEAQQNARDPEKDQRIRAKVDELLAKLEGF